MGGGKWHKNPIFPCDFPAILIQKFKLPLDQTHLLNKFRGIIFSIRSHSFVTKRPLKFLPLKVLFSKVRNPPELRQDKFPYQAEITRDEH